MSMTNNENIIRKITRGLNLGKVFIDGKGYEVNKDDGKVFDKDSYNFHLYPNEQPSSEDISQFKEKRTDIRNELKKCQKDPNFIVNSHKGNSNNVYPLFLYIYVTYKSVAYELNFLRFSIDKNQTVNCYFKELQFDRCMGKYVNQTTTGDCDICYPREDDDQNLKDIIRRRLGDSFCFDPQNITYESSPKEIANAFYEFVTDTDKITNELKKWIGECDTELNKY